jgi:GAF domain-containing protein
MVIKLNPELEAALNESARQQGITPDALAIQVLQRQFLSIEKACVPQDVWERELLQLAADCNVSLPHAALSSEGLYE